MGFTSAVSDQEFIKLWKNTAVACRELNMSRGCVSNCANNKVNTAGGFKWKYKNK